MVIGGREFVVLHLGIYYHRKIDRLIFENLFLALFSSVVICTIAIFSCAMSVIV